MDASLYPNLETTAKVDVWFKLQRKIAAETGFTDVVGAEIKKVPAGTASVTWPNMPETDGDGQTYIYAVQEVDEAGADFTPPEFTKSGGEGTVTSPRDVTLTNIMQKGTASLTVEKALLDNAAMNGGNVSSGTAAGTPIAFTFEVIGPYGYKQTFTLTPGASKTLPGLSAGQYKVTETNAQGYVPAYAPAQTAEVAAGTTANTVTVTNSHAPTNDPNAKKENATKVWSGGASADRTPVTLILSRTVNGADYVDVTDADYTVTPETNGSSSYGYTWSNLPRHSPEGFPYTYAVREDGTEVLEGKTILRVRDNIYDVTQTGNTVTNTFRVQYQQITASKAWDVTNAVGLTPEAVDVWFHLYRKLPAGLPERMTTTAPVKLAANLSGTSYTWPEEMPLTDGFGNVYDYYVVEVDASGNPWTPLNYTADTTNDLVVTNTFNAEDDRQGKLTIRKALIDNSALPGGNPSVSGVVGDDPLEFTFLVKGPYGYEEPVTLTAGTEVTLENLLYGEYTVEETVTHDYVLQYIPAGGKANVAPGQLQPPVVEVKNNHDAEDDQNVVAVRAFKQWEGSEGEKPAPLTLYRAPGVPTDTMPLLAVNAAPVIQDLGNGLYQYDWTNLPEHNPYGSTYQYTVKESTFKLVADDPASPDIFMVEGRYFAVTHETDADGIVTVTNTFMQPESATLEVTAIKTLSGAALKNEQFTFALSVADSDVNLNAKNDETGAVVFEPISFNKQGDYLITVREVDEKARNYIYDGTTYTILVKVTTDKNNVLQLETTYERDGQPHEGELQFTNTYEKEPSAITSSPIAARVELIGRTLKDREFEFQLRDGADNVMDTVRNGPDGRFSFGTQRFSREGTYVYTIQQVKGTEEGMFYDMEPIRVRITVREGRSGMLEVFMEFLLPTAHATDTGRVLTSGTTYTKAGVDVTSDPLLTNRVGIPPTGDNALTMPLVMMALSLMGLGLWLFSKMRRTDTV